MAGSSAALSASELAFVAAGKPILVGANALAGVASDPVWNNGTNGSYTGETDQSDVDFPTAAAFDGDLDDATQPLAAAAAYVTAGDAVWRLIFRIDPTINVDVAIIAGLNLGSLGGTYVVTLQLSDDPTFPATAATVEIEQWAAIASDRRLVSVDLRHTGSDARRYVGYTYGRVIIRRSSYTGTFRPTIGEVVLGPRRQLEHKPNIDGGYDDAALFSKRTIVESRTGARSAFVEYEGRREIEGEIVVNFDEAEKIRSWFEECGFGTGHFAWIEDPSSDPAASTYWMDLEESRLAQPLGGPLHREWTIRAVELPPYVSEEAA